MPRHRCSRYTTSGRDMAVTQILQGVEFTVSRGEIVAIIGRNGVGKSTLMKALIGLLEARTGTILFQREDITSEPADARARRGIGYIPQGREIFPRLTVWENLVMGTQINRRKQEKRFDVVRRSFPILWERLAGGRHHERRRAAAAGHRARARRQPGFGLSGRAIRRHTTVDGEADRRGYEALNKETGLTVLFVEQNIDMILAMTERCYVMERAASWPSCRPRAGRPRRGQAPPADLTDARRNERCTIWLTAAPSGPWPGAAT